MESGLFDADVVVSGYGPTGQAAASLLARLGHRVIVFEKFPSLYGLPRLCSVDGEAARIIQTAGDVDRAFRVSSWCRSFDLIDDAGELIVSMDWSDRHMCGYPGRILFYQPDVEDVLDAAAREYGAEINQGWEVVGVDEDAAGILVTAKQAAEGEPSAANAESRQVRTRYLIGADGARSAVRELLGIEREDFGFRDSFLGIDCHRIGVLPERLSSGRALAVCDPERHLGFVPIGNNRMRFEFGVEAGDDVEAMMTPEVGYQMLQAMWQVSPEQVQIYRQVVYPFEGKIARPWRSGNVFLAGDAAHLMPPFLGQGACSGLRDSINLSWKLHLVLSGTSSDALLDTYELEREPHVRTLTLGAIALGEISMERDPVRAAARNASYRAGTMPRPQDDPTLLDGIFARDDQGDLLPYAGHLMEQGIVRVDGQIGRFDDIVGWGFHLIGHEFNPADYLDESQLAFLQSIGCRTITVSNDPDAGGALDLDRTYEAFFTDRGMIKVILSRPDFYIFGHSTSPHDTGKLVDDLRRQLHLVEVAASAQNASQSSGSIT